MATLAENALGAGRIVAPRIDLRRLPRMDAGALLRRSALQLADADIVVDLGDSIGSGHWWRGFATLGALAAAALALGSNVPLLPGPVPGKQPEALQAESRAIGIGPLAQGSRSAPRAAPTPLARRLAEAPERPRVELSANVGSGGLEAALRRAGVGRDDLDRLFSELRGVASPGGVKPGTSLNLVLGRRESKAVARPLEYLAFRANFETKVEARRGADGQLVVKPVAVKIDNTPLRITGTVGASLERSARAAGLPASVVQEYLRQLGYALDVQRDVNRRDKFEIIVAHRRAETGETEMGRLLYAGLMNGRSNVSLMRWGDKGDFFWQTGEAVRKGLMRTPIAGARLTSGFGMRFHPVLGYSRMHKGVDFGAATGTPILASAGGKVVFAGWGGGYGNVVVIDHGKGIRTRYAHMHRIGVKNGQQIAQGQSIGQVGTTGLSTGPHLHYEVWQNGTAVDPRSVKFFSGTQQLGGADLGRFKGEMARLKAIRASD
ncbi:M23 family peptidase [Sandaracinobacter neustonicus]|uniref:M23 family peptidase n=1 Tax=Sandaracinobacter neustonicus TaxID=1715348 RepID=A0A501XYA9_9SPHN|nr:M23 family metallopeptidase [Sandaracinobacter neustonicus]TPE65054.1 M23 family peptidase [Sandaracinobacter neustonicus]